MSTTKRFTSILSFLNKHKESLAKEMFWRLFEEVTLLQCSRESLFHQLTSAIEKSLNAGSLDEQLAHLCSLAKTCQNRFPAVMVDDCLDVFLSSVETVLLVHRVELDFSESDVQNALLFFHLIVELTKLSSQEPQKKRRRWSLRRKSSSSKHTEFSTSSSSTSSTSSSSTSSSSPLQHFSKLWSNLKKDQQKQGCDRLFELFFRHNPKYRLLFTDDFEASTHTDLLSLLFTMAHKTSDVDFETLDCFADFRSRGRQFSCFAKYGLTRRHFGHFSAAFLSTLKELDSFKSCELPKDMCPQQFYCEINSELSVYLQMALQHIVLDCRGKKNLDSSLKSEVVH